VSQDEDLIRRTLSEYSRRCDDGRFEELADLFTEDARLMVLDRVIEGRDAVRGYLETVQADGSRGLHVTTNSLIDVDGDGATASTDYLFVRPGPEGMAILAAGRYLDELVRDGARWRFRVRTITMLGVPTGGNHD
jgi:ketosteroid isomerase-like protein